MNDNKINVCSYLFWSGNRFQIKVAKQSKSMCFSFVNVMLWLWWLWWWRLVRRTLKFFRTDLNSIAPRYQNMSTSIRIKSYALLLAFVFGFPKFVFFLNIFFLLWQLFFSSQFSICIRILAPYIDCTNVNNSRSSFECGLCWMRMKHKMWAL